MTIAKSRKIQNSGNGVRWYGVDKQQVVFSFELGPAEDFQGVEPVWKGLGVNGEDVGIWNIKMEGDGGDKSPQKSYQMNYLSSGKIQIQSL